MIRSTTFRRRCLVLALVALTACAFDEASAGVEVVSSGDGSGSDGSGGRAEVVPTPTVGLDAGAPGDELGVVVDADQPGGTVSLPLPIAKPSTVAVVGDSLTLSADVEIEAALAGVGLDVLALDGLENRRMVRGGSDLPPGVDAIAEILDGGLAPELWIIALGTNDVGGGLDAATFRDHVAEVLTAVPPGAPVIWVDIWIRDRADQVVDANRVIRSVSAMRPSTLIVDWHDHGDEPGIITSDGVHLTDEGQRLFAATMASAVELMFAG